jgi:hypothetical protein
MEIVVIGLAVVALVVAAKFVGWVFETLGLPVIITAVLGILVHTYVHCSNKALAIVCGVCFVVCLLSGKK